MRDDIATYYSHICKLNTSKNSIMALYATYAIRLYSTPACFVITPTTPRHWYVPFIATSLLPVKWCSPLRWAGAGPASWHFWRYMVGHPLPEPLVSWPWLIMSASAYLRLPHIFRWFLDASLWLWYIYWLHYNYHLVAVGLVDYVKIKAQFDEGIYKYKTPHSYKVMMREILRRY